MRPGPEAGRLRGLGQGLRQQRDERLAWTSADDETSSSEPSRPGRPALAVDQLAIFVSMVCAAMMRQAVTGSA